MKEQLVLIYALIKKLDDMVDNGSGSYLKAIGEVVAWLTDYILSSAPSPERDTLVGKNRNIKEHFGI